ncbi:uncharacterized protein LOC144061067 isoform X1 [Vanacampus margaritifer]
MTDQSNSSSLQQQNTQNVESAVRVLLDCLSHQLGSTTSSTPVAQPTSQRTVQPAAMTPTSSVIARPGTVQQEMQRCFPVFASQGQKRKRSLANPLNVSVCKLIELQFCLLSTNIEKTPKEETFLLEVGLGRRTINMGDNADHAEVVLDLIKWPEESGLDDEDGYSVDCSCRIMGYLRQLVRTESQENLKRLLKFWVGWEIPMPDMKVEVVRAEHPTSSTCFQNLKLPGHYSHYTEFSDHLKNCIATTDTGFGLV